MHLYDTLAKADLFHTHKLRLSPLVLQFLCCLDSDALPVVNCVLIRLWDEGWTWRKHHVNYCIILRLYTVTTSSRSQSINTKICSYNGDWSHVIHCRVCWGVKYETQYQEANSRERTAHHSSRAPLTFCIMPVGWPCLREFRWNCRRSFM